MDILPNELLWLIASFMPSTDLNTLSRTCKLMYQVSEEFLHKRKSTEYCIHFQATMNTGDVVRCIEHLKHEEGKNETLKFIKIEPITNHLLHLVEIGYRSDDFEYEYCYYYPISGYSRVGYDAQTIMRHLFHIEGHAGEVMAKLLMDCGYTPLNMYPDSKFVSSDNAFCARMPLRKSKSKNDKSDTSTNSDKFWKMREQVTLSDFDLTENHPDNLFHSLDSSQFTKKCWQYVFDWFACSTVNYSNLFSRHPDTSVVINNKCDYYVAYCSECDSKSCPNE